MDERPIETHKSPRCKARRVQEMTTCKAEHRVGSIRMASERAVSHGLLLALIDLADREAAERYTLHLVDSGALTRSRAKIC